MIEDQHPIPQQISSYQFRLVGDMTIKQFFYVAGGALVSLFFYTSGLPSYFKWPLVIFSFLLGLAFAFFPLQDRPLSTWIILFIKAIYSPTIYVWKKGAEKRVFFQPEEDSLQLQKSSVSASTKPKAEEEKALDEKESNFLSNITKQVSKSDTKMPLHKNFPDQIRDGQIVVPKKKSPAVEIDEDKRIKIDDQSEKISGVVFGATPIPGQNVQSKVAQFTPEAAPPSPPTTPNVIVGQVMENNGNIVDSAILEVLDNEGRPVRALRSNKLGHFMIVTPLSNGSYKITIEKEGYKFDPLSFEANGIVIPPIAIKGQKLETKL